MIRQVIFANAILLIQYAVGSLIPLLLVPHIVSVIGLTEYGYLAVLMAWGGYGAVIVQYAFQMTGPKKIAHLTINESPASVFIDIAFAKIILLFIVLPVIAVFTFFSMPLELTSHFAWILLIAPPIAAGFNSVWFLQAQGRFFSICILAIIGSLSSLVIGFNFIKSDNSQAVDFSVIVNVFGAVFTAIGTLLLAIFSIKEFKYKWNIKGAINSLSDGRHLFASQFISMFYSASGPIIINYLFDANAAGAYSVTERVIGALMSAALLTHTAAYPKLAFAYINNRIAYWRLLKFILLGYLAVTGTLALLVFLLHERIVKFMYSESSDNHNILLFWGLAWLILGIFGSALTGYLTVSGQSRKVWSITLKIFFSTIIVGIPGMLIFGGVGWMAALVLSQTIVIVTGVKYWRKENVK